MRRFVFGVLLTCTTCGLARAAGPATRAADPLAATAAARAAFDAGDYPAAVGLAAKLLALKGDAAAGYDRHELFVLKGEGHLRLKQFKNAADAFAAAARNTNDDVLAATARATSSTRPGGRTRCRSRTTTCASPRRLK